MKNSAKMLLTAGLMLGLSNTAAAYVGPGAGLSLLGALWGLLIAVFAAVAFVLLWPLRKMMKARRAKATQGPAADHPSGMAEPSPQAVRAPDPAASSGLRN